MSDSYVTPNRASMMVYSTRNRSRLTELSTRSEWVMCPSPTFSILPHRLLSDNWDGKIYDAQAVDSILIGNLVARHMASEVTLTDVTA